MTGYRHHIEKRKKNKKHMICMACREAMRLQAANYRKRRILNGAKSVQRTPGNARHYKLVGGELMIDATGTRRRLQALACMGYSWNVIGEKVGQHGNNFGFVVRMRKWVMPETAEKVMALYDELNMIPAVSVNHAAGNPVKVVKTRSASKGWVPPFGWEEDLIDDPYHLPAGLTHEQAYTWFWNCATEIERVEWVLENRLAVTRKEK